SNDAAKAAISEQAQHVGCPPVWSFYCTSQFNAINWALAHGKKVIVVTQPYLDETHDRRHEEQQDALRGMLAAKFATDPRVKYVDLGTALDSRGKDRQLFYDTVHLVPEGNAVIARNLIRPVAELMADVFELPPAAGTSG